MIKKLMLLGVGGLCLCFQSYGQILKGYNSIGLGTDSPRALLDVAGDISNGKLGSVFGRLVEGDAVSEGTFLGVRGFGSTISPGVPAVKSFALEHSFYGVTNSSINFFRGEGPEDGFLAFNTGKNAERLRIDNKGNIGLGTSSPRALFDIGADLSNGKLGSVFGRLVEGDAISEGTFLGVRGYSSALSPGVPAVKSFALEHSFYGVTNSSINFFRGGGSEDGFLAFNTGKNVEKLRIDNRGNVGLGTTSPRALLDVGADVSNGKLGSVFGRLVEGDAILDGTFLGVRGYSSVLSPGGIAVKSFALEHSFYGVTNSSINFFRGGGSEDGFIAFNTGKNVERMRLENNGNVSIVTPNAKFLVNGNILATSIKVQNQVWPDYVFEPAYEKLTLPELEKFIQTNKHLPEIPSAKTVAKDGIDLGDMNAKLLKKIEELTLYTIDQDKRLNRKDKDFSELKEKMDGLEAKLEKLISAQKN